MSEWLCLPYSAKAKRVKTEPAGPDKAIVGWPRHNWTVVKKKSVLPDLRMLVARVALRERSGDIVAPRYQLTNPELFPRKARAMVQGRGDATN